MKLTMGIRAVFMLIVFSLVGLLPAYCLTPEESLALYKERAKVALAENNAYIQRLHEEKMAKSKIEILARLQEAGASKINVYQSQGVVTQVQNDSPRSINKT